MRTANLVKIFTASVFFTTSVLVSDLATAQAQQSTETKAQTVVGTNVQTSESAPPLAPDVTLRGGYNVGPGTASRVPGCTGPVSFCNMYSGS
ncbi:hypothetical protein AWB71_02851 [Caballeronia peredens]|nr:hypothetical protein AWB71_02851 [Caballeronia peredens]